MGKVPSSALFILSFQKRTDEYLEFDYVILLHENVSQVKNPLPKKVFLLLYCGLCNFDLGHKAGGCSQIWCLEVSNWNGWGEGSDHPSASALSASVPVQAGDNSSPVYIRRVIFSWFPGTSCVQQCFGILVTFTALSLWEDSITKLVRHKGKKPQFRTVQRNYLLTSYIFTSYPQEIIPWQMTVLWHPQHGIEVTQNSCQAKHALD